MLVQGKILSNQDDLLEVYDIRRKVLIEEIGLSESDVFNDYDSFALHAIIYEGDEIRPVATGSIKFDGSHCCINNLAVLKDFRGKGYGDFTMRMLIGKAFQSGINRIYLVTNLNCVEFFKTFGFREYMGEDSESKSYFKEMVLYEEWYITGCHKKK